MKKNILLIFSCIFIAYMFSMFHTSDVHIIFCDVGQGDATLIQIKTTQFLIDAGPNDAVLHCLENHMPFWDKTIEFFLLTHMDSDHIGGAPQVLEDFTVNYLFMNPSTKKTSDFTALERVVSRKKLLGLIVISTHLGQHFRLNNGILISVISPHYSFPQENYHKYSSTETMLSDKSWQFMQEFLNKSDENSLSIALKIEFGTISLVLPGDLESSGELALVENGLLEKTTLLKAGHHGSKTSSMPGFIEFLQPELTVISSGENSAYNHPSPQVVETFEQFGVDIFQTKNSGELHFVTDGERIWEY